MPSLVDRLTHRHGPEPAPDVGLPAERTAMAWQRTALGLAGFSALLVHLAGGGLLLAVPGVLGLVIALFVLVVGERRYSWTVRRVAAKESPLAPHLVGWLTTGVVFLSVSALAVVLTLGI